jgi:hypothetical protein
LEWGYQLRTDLEARIDSLRAALADMEPLREELGRLEQQLKGVERLIEVYHLQLGYPRRRRAEQARTEGETETPPSELPVVAAKVEAPDIVLSAGAAPPPQDGGAWREGLLRIARDGQAAAGRAWVAASAWVGRRFPRSRAQS